MPIKVNDWKASQLKFKLQNGMAAFNQERSTEYYREDEIDYMINTVKLNSKQFKQVNLLQPIFNKAAKTLEKIMSDEELCMPEVFQKMQAKLGDASPETTLKLLVRCRMMLDSRG